VTTKLIILNTPLILQNSTYHRLSLMIISQMRINQKVTTHFRYDTVMSSGMYTLHRSLIQAFFGTGQKPSNPPSLTRISCLRSSFVVLADIAKM